jgi:2-oxoglutarate ferredoxin oxidoreductase subunit beta
VIGELNVENRSIERYLRQDRLPHIWCPGCGIGIAVDCFLRAIDRAHIDPDKLSLVSGIGCAGRVAGYA